MTLLSTPIGTEVSVRGRAREVVRDGGADPLARCLANMPVKEAAALIDVEYRRQLTSYPERALDPGLPLKACKRTGSGTQWPYDKNPRDTGRDDGTVDVPRGVPGESADSQTLRAAPRTPFGGGGRARAAVDESEENVGIHRELGGGLARNLADFTGLLKFKLRTGARRIEHHCSAGGQLARDSGHMGGDRRGEGGHRLRISSGMGSWMRVAPKQLFRAKPSRGRARR